MKVERIDEWEAILRSAIQHYLPNFYDRDGKPMSGDKRNDLEDAMIKNFKIRLTNRNIKEIKL